jgi:hypothetical protein
VRPTPEGLTAKKAAMLGVESPGVMLSARNNRKEELFSTHKPPSIHT